MCGTLVPMPSWESIDRGRDAGGTVIRPPRLCSAHRGGARSFLPASRARDQTSPKIGQPPFWATPVSGAWMKFFTNIVCRGDIGSGVFFISPATMCRIEIHGCVFVSSPPGDHPFKGKQALFYCGRNIFETLTPAKTLTIFGSITPTQGKITFWSYSHQFASLWS